jgi:hypothetical protein
MRLLVMVDGNLIMGSYGSIGFWGSYVNIFLRFVRIWGFCFWKELLLGFGWMKSTHLNIERFDPLLFLYKSHVCKCIS